jgi:hypothetical protein
MAIPGSGAITAQTINFELARSRSSELSIDTAENGGYATINTNSESYPNSANPAAYSEWYGYNHTAGGGGGFEVPLGYNASNQNRACSDFFFGPSGLRFIDTPGFAEASAVWQNSELTVLDLAGWYSDGGLNRYLSVNRGSASFTIEEPCIL